MITLEEARDAQLKKRVHFLTQWDEDERQRQEVSRSYEKVDMGWHGGGELPEGLKEVVNDPAELGRMAQCKPVRRKG
jgi:hypothetical protein